jgi:hypothetical protein
MVLGSNFLSFFRESPLDRERRETREAWAETERLWSQSRLAAGSLGDLAFEIMKEVMLQVPRLPSAPVLVALDAAVEGLLAGEQLGALVPEWQAIEGDPAVGLSVRQMLSRRRRWCANFDAMVGIVTRCLVPGLVELVGQLPEGCFREWPGGGGSFGVPLAELLDRPAETVARLLTLPYDDDTLRYEVFLPTRLQLGTNLAVASGFPADTNPAAVADRLKGPLLQKGKSPAELSRMYLGSTPLGNLLDLPVPFKVPEEARFEHCHIVGGTGHGKTQLLQRMIWEDLVAAQHERRGVVVIDSQGDLIGKLRRLALFSMEAADSLWDRLIVIDPGDVEYPASLNLFDAHLHRMKEYRSVDQERVLNGVVELYETFFGDLLGAELTQKQGVIFKYLARLMLTIPGATIHTLMELMEDGRPFRPHMEELEGSARYFFQKEFFDPSFSATKKQILKRLWGVLSTPAFERMFAQKENKLDLFQALQDGKIILVSTAKDLLKREGSQLFGRFFIAMLAQAALERSTLAEGERTPSMVYVDEAQEYFGDDIETILNQARKYRVGLTLAHQTLDQLSPRLRSVLAANTSVKCVGGVSAKDARAFADDLHTAPDFIESMRRRGGQSEFAVWVKNHTPHAVRLSVPLGFLERQPTLLEEEFEGLLEINRVRYCGTFDDVERLSPAPQTPERAPVPTPTLPQSVAPLQKAPRHEEAAPRPRPPMENRELGKGGPNHRYLQSLVKELGEAQGFRATVEAPLARGAGQVDVLLERTDMTIAFEISVTTAIEQERANVRKCLAAGYPWVALVLVKSKRSHVRFRDAVLEGLADEERSRVACLTPEEVPDYLANLPQSTETVVRGYRVKVNRTPLSPEDGQAKRAEIARIISQKLR